MRKFERGIKTAEADRSGDPAHDCNAGAKERNTQGHPEYFEALAVIDHP